jgi:hypothetical protein
MFLQRIILPSPPSYDKKYLDLMTLTLLRSTVASDRNKQHLLYNVHMNILSLFIITFFITIIVLAKNRVFGGKMDILRKLFKALSRRGLRF